MTIHHFIIPPHSDVYDTPTHPTVLIVIRRGWILFMSWQNDALSDEVNLAFLAPASDLSWPDFPSGGCLAFPEGGADAVEPFLASARRVVPTRTLG